MKFVEKIIIKVINNAAKLIITAWMIFQSIVGNFSFILYTITLPNFACHLTTRGYKTFCAAYSRSKMCRRPSTARSLRARSAACSRPLCARFFARTNDLFLSQFSRCFFLLDIDKSNPNRNETQNQLRNYSTTTLNLNDANLQPSSIRKVFANN